MIFIQIHNFFSDILLSVTTLFENYLFDYKPFFFGDNIVERKPRRFIQSYQFNIGNRTYQIGDYKEAAKIEFPTAIVSLSNDETAFGKSLSLIGHHQIQDVNEVPVLYNRTTKKYVYVREEQSHVNMNIQINCESQLQAKEIEHQIRRFVPLNKYIQFMSFTSFMELPSRFITKEKFNPEKHEIDNLFFKTERETGIPIWCYSLQYKPLIRLNSCYADIGDSSARSWAVTVDLTYLIQLPMWIFLDTDRDKPERVNISFSYGSFEPIADSANQIGTPLDIDGTPVKPQLSYIVRNDDDCISTDEEENKTITAKLPEDFFSIKDQPIKITNGGSSEIILSTDIRVDNDVIVNWDEINNQVILKFKHSVWDKWEPTQTSPIIIQFLRKISDDENNSNKKRDNMFNNIYIPKNKR